MFGRQVLANGGYFLSDASQNTCKLPVGMRLCGYEECSDDFWMLPNVGPSLQLLLKSDSGNDKNIRMSVAKENNHDEKLYNKKSESKSSTYNDEDVEVVMSKTEKRGDSNDSKTKKRPIGDSYSAKNSALSGAGVSGTAFPAHFPLDWRNQWDISEALLSAFKKGEVLKMIKSVAQASFFPKPTHPLQNSHDGFVVGTNEEYSGSNEVDMKPAAETTKTSSADTQGHTKNLKAGTGTTQIKNSHGEDRHASLEEKTDIVVDSSIEAIAASAAKSFRIAGFNADDHSSDHVHVSLLNSIDKISKTSKRTVEFDLTRESSTVPLFRIPRRNFQKSSLLAGDPAEK